MNQSRTDSGSDSEDDSGSDSGSDAEDVPMLNARSNAQSPTGVVPSVKLIPSGYLVATRNSSWIPFEPSVSRKILKIRAVEASCSKPFNCSF